MNVSVNSWKRGLACGGLALALLCALNLPAQDKTRARRADRFDKGPKPGMAAPDFELKSIDGQTFRASALWSNQPIVIMTGSYSCPVFRGKTDSFEQLTHDFSNRVQFVVLYTQEAHPKGDPSPYRGKEWVTPANERAGILLPQPRTIEERKGSAEKCAAALRLSAPVIVDKMDNAAWKAYGSAPNSACLVGRGGKVIEWQSWFDPAKMREVIERHLAGQPDDAARPAGRPAQAEP